MHKYWVLTHHAPRQITKDFQMLTFFSPTIYSTCHFFYSFTTKLLLACLLALYLNKEMAIALMLVLFKFCEDFRLFFLFLFVLSHVLRQKVFLRLLQGNVVTGKTTQKVKLFKDK